MSGEIIRKKILVVDDEIDLVRALQIRLEASNYEVLTAYNGLEGFEKASETKPDLILLDILMPKMNGYETLQKLKENSKTKSIPVIMLTAQSQIDNVTDAADLGAEDYIVKPFEPQVLIQKIKQALL